MAQLLTRDGRIPKNKWLVLPYTGGRIISRHVYKSAAMDKALMMTYRTGKTHVVCETKVTLTGKPFLETAFDTKREAASLR
jgi:hypothetical protein